MKNETAREIVQNSEQLGRLVNSLYPWKSDTLPKGIGAMRETLAQGDKAFGKSLWEGMCEAFKTARLRKRALSYMCLNASLSPTEAIAVVQYEICNEHIKGEEAEVAELVAAGNAANAAKAIAASAE